MGVSGSHQDGSRMDRGLLRDQLPRLVEDILTDHAGITDDDTNSCLAVIQDQGPGGAKLPGQGSLED